MLEHGFALLGRSKDVCVVQLFRLYHRHRPTIIFVDSFSSLIHVDHFPLQITKTKAIYVMRFQESVFQLKRGKQHVCYSAAAR